MKRREFLVASVGLLAGSTWAELPGARSDGALPPGGSAPGHSKPNIVVILADDLGYADLGCQGCRDIPTPHTDSLATNGIRFTNGYSNHPVCSPSRAALLSGRYQHRFGFEHNSGPEEHAAENFGLPREELTLAERLKGLGYATGMVGKWHVGFNEGLRPHERGFDYHFGFLGGAHNYLPGGKSRAALVRNGERVEESDYLTDVFAREASDFVDRGKDGPFFLYLAFNAVHTPLQATGKYEERFADIADPKRRTYAGMLSAMDDAVGRVLGKLREHNLEEDTLVFFYSDNGGPTRQTTSSNAPLRGYKGQVLEGGIRVPFLAQWKGALPAGAVYPHMVMGFDVHATALAAAGGAMPTEKPLDGVNLLPYLTGKEDGAPHERLFWRAGQQRAVREGNWKLVQVAGEESQLYNLGEDIGESRNLAEAMPDIVQRLQSVYGDWDKQMSPAKWVRQDGRSSRSGRQPGERQPNAERRGALQERFNEYDRDQDGKVTAQEFPRADLFEAMDANKDGALTLQEAQNYSRSRRQVEEE
ncbi:MAG: sulfatase-like hydrolase/transferase [Candidatus Hydrogenedentes bacterium]|nr:sulfatase-like hydrolase/transferase [Candidatus Hydrogenedentota bacterium]